MKKYIIAPDGKSIHCLLCGMTSYHSEDVRQHYCGKCHVFHEEDNVELTFLCGHTVVISSPGVHDPAGMFLKYPQDPDGMIRVSVKHRPCWECEKEK